MNNETKTLKEKVEAEKKRKFDLKQELAKAHRRKEKEPTKVVEKETQAKIDVLEYVASLPKEKRQRFINSLKKDKVANDFTLYLKYVYGDFYKMTRFHAYLCRVCNMIVSRVEKGDNIVVCISVPPQHGKSTTITEALPSYFLGRNPDEGVIICSYDAETAERFGNSNREKIREFGKELFGVEISDEMDTKTRIEIKGRYGQMLSTGVFGKLTSNKASLIIFDDPFKSKIESESKTYRDKVHSIAKTCAETRFRPGKGSALVIIQTRWHEDDLIGRYAREPRTIYINIPEVWDSSFGEDRWLGRKAGEPLCPELGETAQWVQDKLNSLGRKDFNALYQGKPYVDGGNIVQRDSIRFYERADLPTEFDDITLSADLSLGGTTDQSDPACISVWGRKGANHYLLNVVNKKMGLNEQIRSINHLCNSYPRIKRKIVEKKANGSAVIETIKNQVDGVIPYDPKGESKTSRLEAVTHFFEAGNIWLPSEKVMPNIEVFVEQLLKFPNATHDDFVDTLSQYLINYECRNGGKVLTDSCYADLSNALRGLTI